MMRRPALGWIAATALGAFLSSAPAAWAQPDSAGVPKDRLARLAKGLNLSMWFAQVPLDANRVRSYVTPADANVIRDLGVTFVRLPVDPTALASPRNLGALDANSLGLLDAAAGMFLSRGVGVVVCPYFNDQLKARLWSDAPWAKAFAAFDAGLATHFAARDPNLFFLETLNEPCLDDQALWDRLQAELVRQVRRAAPRMTIIATSNQRAGGRGDMIGGLLATQVVADRNVVYDFHCYDPMQFTHQGATWMPPQMRFYKDVPYPSSPKAVRPLLAGIADEGARDFLELYGREEWGRQRVQAQLQRAIAWGKNRKVPVVLGEFGVYRPNCPAADRERYLRDCRDAMEAAGAGWAMWEYYGGFGVVTDKEGKRVVDKGAAEALGLNPSATFGEATPATAKSP